MAVQAAATLHQNDIERPDVPVGRVAEDSEHAVGDVVLSGNAYGYAAHLGEAPRDGSGPEPVAPAATRRVALARRRREVCKTQEALAFETGVHRTTVARWESGETTPSLWVRPRIANALNIPIDALLALLGADVETARSTRDLAASSGEPTNSVGPSPSASPGDRRAER
ncbi:helix-turn-helix transcriptional regulator [Myceligenerans crystallogenes]|uniref:HTH cro/C1-type domain-containing protein n=1 Tax=Myceligenerans crystallogenes TaxID=316335 RepID=A0ABN2NGG5_9MICO